MYPGISLLFRGYLPDVKYRVWSYFFAILLLSVGYYLSHIYATDYWFTKSGIILSLLALLFGYFGRLKICDISNWAKTIIEAFETIRTNAKIVDELNWFDRNMHGDNWYQLKNTFSEVKLPLNQSEIDIIITATGLEDIKSSPNKFIEVLIDIRDKPQFQNVLADFINKRLTIHEILIGAIGVVVAGFGNLIV